MNLFYAFFSHIALKYDQPILQFTLIHKKFKSRHNGGLNCIDMRKKISYLRCIRVCLFLVFYHFLITFQEIQKLDGSKSEKLKASFYELLSFSLLGHPTFGSLKS
jgi:hypothetical protein